MSETEFHTHTEAQAKLSSCIFPLYLCVAFKVASNILLSRSVPGAFSVTRRILEIGAQYVMMDIRDLTSCQGLINVDGGGLVHSGTQLYESMVSLVQRSNI
jgi:hypothetical protein